MKLTVQMPKLIIDDFFQPTPWSVKPTLGQCWDFISSSTGNEGYQHLTDQTKWRLHADRTQNSTMLSSQQQQSQGPRAQSFLCVRVLQLTAWHGGCVTMDTSSDGTGRPSTPSADQQNMGHSSTRILFGWSNIYYYLSFIQKYIKSKTELV